jgi:cyclophilin family peptidyl-prolyl cis-trans isomerase
MKIRKLFTFLVIQLTCVAAISQSSYTFNGKPLYEIEAKRNNGSIGKIVIELFPTVAPLHVRNFDSLVAHKFYDTTAFHRVIPTFVIQGGDPNSRHGPESTWGYGQPGQPKVNAEFSPLNFERGTLAAARSQNINSATSQFFICVDTAYRLNGKYTIYGQVLSGLDVVDTIVNAPTTVNDRPIQKIEMFIKRIGTNDSMPGTPQLLEPMYDQHDMDTTVELKWSSVKGARQYQVQVSADITFLTEVDSLIAWDTTVVWHNLQDTTIYYWRVRAIDGGNFGAFTEGKFSTVGETTGLGAHAGLSPFSVYPNPGAGIFTFTGVEPGMQIRIYSGEGKLLRSTPCKGNGEQVNIDTFPKGVYFYTVTRNHVVISGGKLLKK